MKPLRKAHKGFTLLEVVVVLVVVGLYAAVAASHFSTLNASAFSDGEMLKAAVRYTRTRALADVVPWSFQVAGQTGTYQRNGVASGTVSFATAGVAAGTVNFDNRGQPTGTLSFAVTGYSASPVVVTAVTGFVP